MSDKKDPEKTKFLNDLEKKLKNKERDPKKKPPNQDPNKKNNGSSWNKFSIFLISILLVFTLLSLYTQDNESSKRVEVAYSDFIKDVENGIIKEAHIVENLNIIDFAKDGIEYTTRIPYIDNDLIRILIDNEVKITSEKREQSKVLLIFLQWLPWIFLMLFFWFIISRQIRGRGGEAFNFGKSKANVVDKEKIKERFSDVKGCKEAIADLEDIVLFLSNSQKFVQIGARIPKGVLLVGSPGTGKTLLARAIAGEAHVPFFSISGSDFVEMFVGVGASRVRDLFENAKKKSPCIIFIDEIDAVGRARGVGYGGGNDEREQTLNQLLVEMDGFNNEQGIIIVAATNRVDVLDKALLRPGRFDRQVVVDIPDIKGRKEILELHAKKIRYSKKDVDFETIARGSIGFTGADLSNLINEAALFAARDNRKEVTQVDLELAKDKIMLGAERKSIFVNPKEKKNTAYHEAGHALVSLLTPEANDLNKVTIIPRGRALGVTHFLPEDGKLTMSKKHLEAELKVLYGGRIAEEIIFKDVTNGAMNDIERATQIARSMVCEWGLSSLGPIFYGENDKTLGYFGNGMGNGEKTYSADIKLKIDKEIKNILDKSYRDAKKLLTTNLSKLKKLSETLLEKETLDVKEICKLLGYDYNKLKKRA